MKLPWSPAPIERIPTDGPYDVKGILWSPGATVASRSALKRQAQSRLIELLKQACTWPEDYAARADLIGAHRFVVVEFSPGGRDCLYVQAWSEPGDDLLLEVSSAHSDASRAKYITTDVIGALLERGFEIGGAAENFRKKLPMTWKDSLKTTSKEILSILVDVLGYKGSVPLEYHLNQDSRADHGRIFRAIQPDDFKRLLQLWGLSARWDPDGSSPAIRAASGGLTFLVEFANPVTQPSGTYELVTFQTAAEFDGPRAKMAANRMNTILMTGRAVSRSPTDVLLAETFVIGGGVTVENLRRQVTAWVEQVRQVLGKSPKAALRGEA